MNMTNNDKFRLMLCPTELFDTLLDSLAGLLHACVHSGASVNFILPFTHEQARTWWSGQRSGIQAGKKLLLLAVTGEEEEDANTVVAGCVILQPAEQPNQPHHAEVKKMLVHPNYQRRYDARIFPLLPSLSTDLPCPMTVFIVHLQPYHVPMASFT